MRAVHARGRAAPSVTRVAICVSRVLLHGLQKKERLLVVYDISDSSVLHTAVVTSTSRYGRMRTRVVRDCYVPWQNKKKKEGKKERVNESDE